MRLARSTVSMETTAVIIGAGHNGLAISRCLGEASIDHVILERGEVANSWRTERWDSLRLLTPNWQCRLPGFRYDGDDPDGFMSMPEVIGFIERYADTTSAPVLTHTTVISVLPVVEGYRVVTDKGTWTARAVVLASGNFNLPNVPGLANELPSSIHQVTPRAYKNPGQLPDGRVLVVGASATGLQLAREIHASGRPTTLAVGEHVRMPRTWRGKDIQYWMDATGILDQRYTAVDDITRARRVPSPQLVGAENRATVDLNRVMSEGIEVVGRLCGMRNSILQFSGSLANHCKMADLKMGRLLASIDEWIESRGLTASCPAEERPAPTLLGDSPRLELDLNKRGFRTVVWATGYRPDYSWLKVPVLDRKGNLRHDGGICDAPGLYAMGMPFMRRRKSSFIHGAEDDARDLGAHLAEFVRDGRDWRAAG